jgi:uncharacterized protein
METIFLGCYDFFKKRKALLFTFFIGSFLLLGFFASRIEIQEDISKFFPVDKKLEKVNQAFQGSRFAEKLVVMVSLKDSSAAAQPDQLIAYTDSLIGQMQTSLSPYVRDINYRVDDQVVLSMFDLVQQHLPTFLTEGDYTLLDSITQPEGIKQTLTNNYRQLISPTGIAVKRIIVKDPVGISNIVLKKLQGLQVNEEFELYDNYFFTKDHRYLLFFVTPSFPTNDTGNNLKFLQQLDEVITQLSGQSTGVTANYFGAVAVAAGNAKQLRADTVLTLSLTIVLLVIFLFGFLRKVSAPLLILVPVLFGGLFSLALIWIIQGTISVLAIAAGSIVLGIAINYSLHFFSHLKETGDVRLVVKDLVAPMTIGSTTTVLAFLSLQFTNASMLSDIGLFAGFSLIGAALCSLIFLPHLLKDNFFGSRETNHTWQAKLFFLQPKHTRYLIPIILLLTPVMLYFASDVQFNSDMTKLNFMSGELKQTEKQLNRITNLSAQSVFVVADGQGIESALRENESVIGQLEQLKGNGVVKKYASVSSFLISDSLQRERINRWNQYWTADKKTAVMNTLREESAKLKFTKIASANFDSLINRKYIPTTGESFDLLKENFFADYVTEKNGLVTIVTPASIDPTQSASFYNAFEKEEHIQPFDKRMLTKMFVSFVHADFTFIVTVTSLIVFLVLLISYGRIELTLMAFAPMLITWIWILGAMALLGIEFNIVNVMISTFIFGLGDDYSIFIMDGLLREYRTGQKTLPSVQDSIFLSAITTISGLGVLIFAQHPALKSIAAISIIGILMVWIMSQTLGPFLFARVISNRAKKKLPPTTLFIFFMTYVIYFAFVSGAVILTIVGFFQFKVFRLTGPRSKYFYHSLLRYFTGVPIYMAVHYKKRILNREGQYERPMVIISNHQSFIDILVTSMLSPKVVLLTNRWVWNSPIFGWVVKMADFYPVDFGIEDSVEPLSKMVKQGYSIMVFPEGSRQFDGEIKRFHKGAFYLAEKLQLDVMPLLIHGSGDCIRKNDLNMHYATLTMKFLAPIRYDDASYGDSYSERAKNIGHYFRQEYKKLREEVETPKSLRHKLISNFLYKGPVLEWYMRIKIRLENYYEPFHQLIPRQASILDLGCGYGFMSYMLHFLSAERVITGVDYDEEKIEVAQHGYLRGENLSFIHADITTYAIGKHDAIIISDVLHYLSPVQQEDMLQKCYDNLNAGGIIILRDGDQDIKQKHGTTRLTEFFSIKLLNFNRSNQPLNFISGEKIKQWAQRTGMEIERVGNQKLTSNVIFALRKK